MHPLARLGRLVGSILLAALAVGACQPTAESLPRLSDPNEILEEAIRTTAELDFVQLRADVGVGIPGGGGTMELSGTAEIDLRNRNVHGLIDLGALGLGAGGESQEFLVIGNDAYAKFGSAEKWMHSQVPPGQDPRAQIPATPAIAVALQAMLEEDGITTTLEGVEGCASGQCYHVVATIAPELVWQLAQGALFGAMPGDGPDAPVDPGIPEVQLDVLVDEATRNLVSVASAGSFQESSYDVTVTLSGHDVPFELRPPAPNQIEDNTGGFEEQLEPVPVP